MGFAPVTGEKLRTDQGSTPGPHENRADTTTELPSHPVANQSFFHHIPDQVTLPF